MATISYKEEFEGNIISKITAYCFGRFPVKGLDDVIFAAGGKKASSLCGFRFESAGNTQNPKFRLMFCAKLRSHIYHAGKNFAMWYAMRPTPNGGVEVLKPDQLMAQYHFDVEKFFNTDICQKMVPLFNKYINLGIKQAEELAKKAPKEEQLEYERCIKAIKESAAKMNLENFRDGWVRQSAFSDKVDRNLDNGHGKQSKIRRIPVRVPKTH